MLTRNNSIRLPSPKKPKCEWMRTRMLIPVTQDADGLRVLTRQNICAVGHGIRPTPVYEGSMSRRGNCHDNAVAESFFQLLKRERVRRHVYATREEARSDVFDYIEMFYNARRRHGFNNQLSPVEYEEQYEKRLSSV